MDLGTPASCLAAGLVTGSAVDWPVYAGHETLGQPVDSRLLGAIGTPKIQQQAGELVRLALRALDDLKQLDEGLYERFLEARKAPEARSVQAARYRRLWDDTFRGLRDVLAYCQTLLSERQQDDAPTSLSFDFGDLEEGGSPAPPASTELDFGSVDFGDLIEGLGGGSQQDETQQWTAVLDKVSSLEYGLRSELRDATSRLEVALDAGEINQVLGLLDDTQSSASQGVHALVAAVYDTFLPDVDAASVVPGYLTSLGRALLVRRGLAELAAKLTPYNDTLQSDERYEHIAALTKIRETMRGFVASPVCRAMRAADRWQMVEFDRELAEQPMAVARQTSEGLAKYIESLASINQREVLVVHDRRTLEEMREALASARQLLDLSPPAAHAEIDRAYRSAQRLRGRHPATDKLLDQLERNEPSEGNTAEYAGFVERLEAMLAGAGG